MCGIAGIVGMTPEPAVLKAMADAMRHRGPDDEGFFRAPHVGLAFRRLSIVDLDGGHQPMSNEDGRVTLVFNGEIYNHLELRRELLAAGHRFQTDHSDTEVLVHGWEQWREGLFSRLNGMFATAIWDDAAQTLTLARDRYGIKPLYYAELADGRLVFGSEIQVLHASGLVPKEASPEGILEYFHFQNLWREPTMFGGVRQLSPATILTWRERRSTKRTYWDITFPRSRRGSMARLAEEHRAIIGRVVKRQIAADVPVMSYLSGGIDSTAITVAAYQLDPRVRAYSCLFNLDGVGADRQVDEREFSRSVARHYGLDHVELELRQDSLTACLDPYVRALEDLRMGMGYPVYLIAQRVAQDSKVVLSGTGGDEYHGGYVGRYRAVGLESPAMPLGPLDRLRQALSWQRVKSHAGRLRRKLRGTPASQPAVASSSPPSPEPIYRSILNSVLRPPQLAEAFSPEFLRKTNGFCGDDIISDYLNACPSQDWCDRVMYVDARTYLTGLLTLEDRLSMAHSLETRVPLLDNELVDFVLDVPFAALWQGETGKVVFRESVQPWVPPEIYRKPKMGFGPPDASWYRGTLRPWIESRLSAAAIQRRGVFQPAFVRRALDAHFSGQSNYTYLIWSLLNFDSWCENFGFFG
jgi:asparagine synthase (glutamine-hydrolysing)